jgi:hypothetical protein
MDTRQISEMVEAWIAEEELPTRPGLFPAEPMFMRLFEDEEKMDSEDIEIENDEWRHFISRHLSRGHQVLESIPKHDEEVFFGAELDEFGNNASAMNTHDFERLHPFDRYHYKVKKMCERVRDLALTHSCISDEEGRINVKNRFLNLVRSECQEKMKLFFKIWREFAYWE